MIENFSPRALPVGGVDLHPCHGIPGSQQACDNTCPHQAQPDYPGWNASGLACLYCSFHGVIASVIPSLSNGRVVVISSAAVPFNPTLHTSTGCSPARHPSAIPQKRRVAAAFLLRAKSRKTSTIGSAFVASIRTLHSICRWLRPADREYTQPAILSGILRAVR